MSENELKYRIRLILITIKKILKLYITMNFVSIKKGTSVSLNIVLGKRKFTVDSSPLEKFFQKTSNALNS